MWKGRGVRVAHQTAHDLEIGAVGEAATAQLLALLARLLARFLARSVLRLLRFGGRLRLLAGRWPACRRSCRPARLLASSLALAVLLAARLLVVRLQLALLPQSTHAIITRLLFSRRSARSFWSYTHTDAEISLIVEEEVLPTFPPDAIVGASTGGAPP